MAKSISTIALVIMFVLLFFRTSLAEMPLELIQVFQSDIAGAVLITGCTSPGDMDNDGFSEMMAFELGSPNRLFMYNGGNPPDVNPDMTIEAIWAVDWIPDINNDGIVDCALVKPKDGNLERVEIWYGDSAFQSKTEPDIILSHIIDEVSGFGYRVYSGDINNDNQNDLILNAVNGLIQPYDGRFYIYYGGDLLDTMCDQVINFYRHDDGYLGFRTGTGLGDINGDGLLDLGYTIYNEKNDTSYFAIILGKVALDSVPDIIFGTPFLGYWNSQDFGKVIEPLGDINKDGFDDFAIGSSVLWPCIFYGGDPFDTIPKILGDTADDLTQGDRIANIGDINHDGWDDIGVGFVPYDFESGIVYIYFGARDMNTDADIIIPWHEVTPTPGMSFGYSIGPAGDFNGDGVDDVAISAREMYGGHPHDHGLVYVFAGDSGLPTPAEDEWDNPIPNKYNILKQNYPNPFNNGTVIEYTLWGISDRYINLSIYNILGQKVRTLYDGIHSGGKHSVYWNGRDDNGHAVCSGLYFYRLKTNAEFLSKKMIYLK